MATLSYLSRVIYKVQSASSNTVAGTYKLLLAARSIPSPVSAPNPVETTTCEDDAQTYKMGIKKSDSKEIKGNLDKDYLDNIENTGSATCDIFFLYGEDGTGSVAKYYMEGQIAATPDDFSGTDQNIEMTATVIPNSPATKVTSSYTVVDNEDGTFTVSAN